MKTISGIILAAMISGLVISAAEAASSAVVIMYHRFGEAEYPSTNTTLEQLDSHIAELTSGGYSVWPVEKIVTHLGAGRALPDRTVGITIDDGYRSIYTHAWPKFRAAGLPFTVFVATGHIDRGSSKHLTWDQIREMRDAGVSIGHHTVSHLHMPKATAARLDDEISGAHARFEKELGQKPALFAYPYGEASLAVSAKIKRAGFRAAFGQHSGVIGSTGDMFNLPRFAMNETYGDLARLRLAANALPLPVRDVTPANHMIGAANPPATGFTVAANIGSLTTLSCFFSHAGKAQVARLSSRVEVRIDTAFPRGRTRLNCTMPTAEGRWRWYGRQFYRP